MVHKINNKNEAQRPAVIVCRRQQVWSGGHIYADRRPLTELLIIILFYSTHVCACKRR